MSVKLKAPTRHPQINPNDDSPIIRNGADVYKRNRDAAYTLGAQRVARMLVGEKNGEPPDDRHVLGAAQKPRRQLLSQSLAADAVRIVIVQLKIAACSPNWEAN